MRIMRVGVPAMARIMIRARRQASEKNRNKTPCPHQ